MKVNYIQGKASCERCGAYIKNIYVIKFDDGYSITVGSECVKKVLKETNLTEKGCLFVEKLMKPIEKYRKKLVEWQNMTYENAIKKNLLVKKWDDKTQSHISLSKEEYEEVKKRMIENLLPKRIKESEEEMNEILMKKGKNIRIVEK